MAESANGSDDMIKRFSNPNASTLSQASRTSRSAKKSDFSHRLILDLDNALSSFRLLTRLQFDHAAINSKSSGSQAFSPTVPPSSALVSSTARSSNLIHSVTSSFVALSKNGTASISVGPLASTQPSSSAEVSIPAGSSRASSTA